MPLEGRHLFKALCFSYPDTIHELIVGSDGAAPLAVIRVADQVRVTQCEYCMSCTRDIGWRF